MRNEHLAHVVDAITRIDVLVDGDIPEKETEPLLITGAIMTLLSDLDPRTRYDA